MGPRELPDARPGHAHPHWLAAVTSVLAIRVVSSGAAFLGNVLVGRQLLPALYGRFAILFSIMTVVAGLVGPALDTCLVRFAARHIAPERDGSGPYFRLVFKIKCWLSAFFILVGVFGAKLFLRELFPTDIEAGSTTVDIKIAFWGGAAMMLWAFAQSYFQAHQQFRRYAGYELLNSVIRLVFVVFLVSLQIKSVLLVITLYAVAPFIVAAIEWFQIPKDLFWGPKQAGIGREFFDYGKWVVLASIFTTLVMRVDIQLLGHFKVASATIGNYGAALNLVLIGELVVLTFYNVLLPKASQIKTAVELRAFARKFLLPSVLCGVAMCPAIPLANILSRVTFGAAYLDTGRLFAILFAGTIATLIASPSVTAVYALGRTRVIALIEGLRLLLTVLIGIWVAPRYGAFGMAWTVMAVRCTIGALTYVAVHVELGRAIAQERG